MDNKYLDESSFKSLMHQITTGIDPDSRDNLEVLETILPSFHAYVDAVVSGETRLLLAGQPEGQTYRDLIMQYDTARHSCHEAAIVNIRILNRLAGLYDLPPVFTGDNAHRHQVAAFCLELDQYFFVSRRMKLS